LPYHKQAQLELSVRVGYYQTKPAHVFDDLPNLVYISIHARTHLGTIKALFLQIAPSPSQILDISLISFYFSLNFILLILFIIFYY
jgi:hypothetical protein